MITAIIVDDEPKGISTLRRFLANYCPLVDVLADARNASEAKKLILSLHPQIIFLDIEMPYGSGFDLLRMLPGLEAEVIFITAFDRYALDAFRYSALDYLLKPVNIAQLKDAVSKAEKRISQKLSAHNYTLFLNNIDQKDAHKRTITFNEKDGQYFIPVSDIMYCIADGSYTHVYTTGRIFVSTRNLKEYESMLPPGIFHRIHHGHLVNKLFITRLLKGRGGAVLMKDGKQLEIAVRRKDDFIKMFAK